MGPDPLTAALEAIRPKLDDELHPLIAALLANEPIEQTWQALLQGTLDEA